MRWFGSGSWDQKIKKKKEFVGACDAELRESMAKVTRCTRLRIKVDYVTGEG